MTDMTVAKEILRQLGGNVFIRMTGASKFVASDDKMAFALPSTPHFVKNKINRVVIRLTEDDLYEVEFARAWGIKWKTIETVDGIYNDMLCEIFTEKTGLDVRL